MSVKQRQDDQQAFLLHTHPYSETSLILDVFSRDHGRLALLARGARRPRSALRGVLIGFQRLELGWFGGGEVKTLAKAEWMGGLPLLTGRCLLLGYYLNELLQKLLPREDAHPSLFDAYGEALAALAGDGADAPELRRFEKSLLKEIGYGLSLDREADGTPIRPDRRYLYLVERGAVAAQENDGLPSLAGKTLLDLEADDYRDPRTLAESKLLMRQLLAHHLNGHVLQSRRVFMDLQEL
ncbi:DNA repair protein RecO [Denitratisoma oestradiolicum]|uniref:DNA repair protein RecO n=1 Tax=Denitratisoma oestradiolicum TaxID=311182 RepID=A0A6S6Y2B4_9PROT|nr:DNA repair protein RecO [Denitratisoma oestradiolicum]TWO80263.1 DNA repair protein RecO [Denitratisoma oestradiolicum]CAB1369356.1 gap repair protein [Denitratisoma oestradiolicum]